MEGKGKSGLTENLLDTEKSSAAGTAPKSFLHLDAKK